MGSWSKVVTNVGKVRPHVLPVAHEIVAITPEDLPFIWGFPGRGTGMHKKGLALDFMTYELGGGVDHPGPRRDWIGHTIAAYLIEHADRLNVDGVIWNRRQASPLSNPPWSWRKYTGSNPHIDHVHADFDAVGTYTPPEDEPVTPEEIEKVAAKAAELVVDKLGMLITTVPRKVWEHVPPNPPGVDAHRANVATYLTYGKVNVDQTEGIVRRMEAKLDAFVREVARDVPDLRAAVLHEAEAAEHETDERRAIQDASAFMDAENVEQRAGGSTFGPGLVIDGGDDDGPPLEQESVYVESRARDDN